MDYGLSAVYVKVSRFGGEPKMKPRFCSSAKRTNAQWSENFRPYRISSWSSISLRAKHEVQLLRRST
jgi:hypothetical protein